MDADLFAKILATGDDSGTTTPSANKPVKQKNAGSPTSSDPFAALFTDQPANSASTSSGTFGALSAQGSGSSMTTRTQTTQQTLKQRRKGAKLQPTASSMSGFGEAPGGGANGELPKELVQKFISVSQQLLFMDKNDPPTNVQKHEHTMMIQCMVQKYQAMPRPEGIAQMQKHIAFVEQDLANGFIPDDGLGPGMPGFLSMIMSGGFPGRGFPGMGGRFPGMGRGFPGMGGGMCGSFPGMGGGFLGGGL